MLPDNLWGPWCNCRNGIRADMDVDDHEVRLPEMCARVDASMHVCIFLVVLLLHALANGILLSFEQRVTLTTLLLRTTAVCDGRQFDGTNEEIHHL